MKNIQDLKDFIYPDNVYSNARANSRVIMKRFPEIYNKIKDDYKVNLYMLLHDIPERPVCLNPSCNNSVRLENIGAGFRKYCSRKCISEHQKTDKAFSKKIRDKHLENSPLSKKYKNLDIKIDRGDKNYYIISNYCNHGDIKIYSDTFKKLYNHGINLCQKCKDSQLDEYTPSGSDIENFQEKFENFYSEYRYLFNEKWFRRFYPKEYKIIISWSSHLDNISLQEAIYLFKNKMKQRPICSACNSNTTYFNKSTLSYTNFCSSGSCRKNTSMGEIEISNYISSIYNYFPQKIHLGKNEFDIYIPAKKIAIEFNGLYWHGEINQPDKNYHYKRWGLCKDSGIKLLTIWEDDWKDKRPIVESIIRNQLCLNRDRLYARKTRISIVDPKDAKVFLENNHIQGWCQSSIKLGLFYKEELISLMTFGRRNIGKKTQFELLRFCNKRGVSVVGGASKLFNHFINNYNYDNIISYANLDISDGNLYEILGFKNLGHTGVNYWWVKGGKKFHRGRFMKHKINMDLASGKTSDEALREMGYYKLYGLGSLKYEYNKKGSPN